MPISNDAAPSSSQWKSAIPKRIPQSTASSTAITAQTIQTPRRLLRRHPNRESESRESTRATCQATTNAIPREEYCSAPVQYAKRPIRKFQSSSDPRPKQRAATGRDPSPPPYIYHPPFLRSRCAVTPAETYPQRLLTARSIIAEKPSTLPRKDKPGSPKPFVSPLLYLLQTARSTVLSVPNFPSDALPCIPRRLRTRRHKQHYRLVKGDPHEGEGYGASD